MSQIKLKVKSFNEKLKIIPNDELSKANEGINQLDNYEACIYIVCIAWSEDPRIIIINNNQLDELNFT